MTVLVPINILKLFVSRMLKVLLLLLVVLDMIERRVEVVARLKALEEAATPLVSFLQNASAVQELRADKQYNLQMLHDRYQVCFVCKSSFRECNGLVFFLSFIALSYLSCRN